MARSSRRGITLIGLTRWLVAAWLLLAAAPWLSSCFTVYDGYRPAAGAAALRSRMNQGAALDGAYVPRARLRGWDFSGRRMAGMDLRDTDLSRANLRGAQILGCDLRGATLAGADLRGATYDRRTRWPAGFHPAAHGARRVE